MCLLKLEQYVPAAWASQWTGFSWWTHHRTVPQSRWKRENI